MSAIEEKSVSQHLVATHDEVILFLLKHDFLFFEDDEGMTPENQWRTGLSPRDYRELRECLYLFYKEPDRDHRRSANDTLIDSDGDEWRFRVCCAPNFIDVKLRAVPPRENPTLEYSMEVRFDFLNQECRVTERINAPLHRNSDGLITGLISKFEIRETDRLIADLSRERQKVLDEVVLTFVSEREASRAEARRNGNRLTGGVDTPDDCSALPHITDNDLRKMFSVSLFKPPTQPKIDDLLLRRQVLYFESLNSASILGDFEVMVLRTGHGLVARVIKSQNQSEWHVVHSWGPLGYSGNLQTEIREVFPREFDRLNLSCGYRTKLGDQKELSLRTKWHYCAASFWGDLSSPFGATIQGFWIVFPFDGDDWKIIKLSFDVGPLLDAGKS